MLTKTNIKFFEQKEKAILEFVGLSNVLDLVQRLKNPDQINDHEPLLRQLEARLIQDNIRLIVSTSKAIGEQLIIDSDIVPPQSNEEACLQRYIYVPILYKLGLTKEASKVGQITFEYLFPQLHRAVLEKIHKLFGSDLNQPTKVISTTDHTT